MPDPSRPPERRAWILLLAWLLLAPAVMLPASADTMANNNPELPQARHSAGVAWDGRYAYVIGGTQTCYGCFNPPPVDCAPCTTFYRYDTATDAFQTLAAQLPSGREGLGAVTIGGDIYILGGSGSALCSCAQIYRYNIAAGTLSASGLLDAVITHPGVAAHGGKVYLVGGAASPSDLGKRILRFDPATNLVTPMLSQLPVALQRASVVSNGQYLYIFGGLSAPTTYTSAIYRFDPATDTLTTLSATLPTPTAEAAAIFDGANVFLVGGRSGGVSYINSVVRFRPADHSVTLMSSSAEGPRALAGAVWTGTHGLVFGGHYGTVQSQVVRYTLQPAAPTGLAASGGAAHQIVLSWSAPPHNTYSELTGYKVYRSATSGGTYTLLATLGNVTSYADNGVPGNTQYWYKVSALNRDGREGPQSAADDGTSPPTPLPPQNLDVTTGPGAGELTLTWQAPPANGAPAVTNYRIYRGTSPGGETLLTTIGNVLTWKDTGLGIGATRYYKVSAVNSNGEGLQSNGDSATTFSPPSVPRDVAPAAGPGAGQITLTWREPATDGGMAITAYKVYRGTSSTNEVLLVTLGASARSHVDSDLGNGATRWYRVSAVNPVDEGPRSTSAAATTFRAPSAPRSLDASAGPGAGEITLTWLQPLDEGGTPVTGYRIYRGTSPGGETLLTTVGNVLTWKDTGLGNAATRHYKVSAVNLVDQGPQSNGDSATTFSTPSAPLSPATSRGPGVGQVSVSWSQPSSDGGSAITGYDVYARTVGGTPTKVGSTPWWQTSFVHTGLPNGAERLYTIKAVNVAGEGAASTEVSGRAPDKPSAPQSFALSASVLNGVTLSWDVPASDGGLAISKYRIYRRTTDAFDPGAVLVELPASNRTFVDKTTNGVNAYYYWITAWNTAPLEGHAAGPKCAGTVVSPCTTTASFAASPAQAEAPAETPDGEAWRPGRTQSRGTEVS